MIDKPKTMTWADLAAWITTLTPEQMAMPAIVFDNEAGAFTSEVIAFLASKDDAGQLVYGESPGEVIEGQPILQVW